MLRLTMTLRGAALWTKADGGVPVSTSRVQPLRSSGPRWLPRHRGGARRRQHCRASASASPPPDPYHSMRERLEGILRGQEGGDQGGSTEECSCSDSHRPDSPLQPLPLLEMDELCLPGLRGRVQLTRPHDILVLRQVMQQPRPWHVASRRSDPGCRGNGQAGVLLEIQDVEEGRDGTVAVRALSVCRIRILSVAIEGGVQVAGCHFQQDVEEASILPPVNSADCRPMGWHYVSARHAVVRRLLAMETTIWERLSVYRSLELRLRALQGSRQLNSSAFKRLPRALEAISPGWFCEDVGICSSSMVSSKAVARARTWECEGGAPVGEEEATEVLTRTVQLSYWLPEFFAGWHRDRTTLITAALEAPGVIARMDCLLGWLDNELHHLRSELTMVEVLNLRDTS